MLPRSSEPQTMENRKFERRKTLLSAKVSTLDSIDDCVVHDLSAGGAEIRTIAAFQLSQKVTLDMPRLGPVQGRVAWIRDQLVGIQFMSPLDEVSLSLLAQPNRASRESPPGSAAGTPAERPSEEGRAGLESRLIELSRNLSPADLKVAVEQIAVLSRYANR